MKFEQQQLLRWQTCRQLINVVELRHCEQSPDLYERRGIVTLHLARRLKRTLPAPKYSLTFFSQRHIFYANRRTEERGLD